MGVSWFVAHFRQKDGKKAENPSCSICFQPKTVSLFCFCLGSVCGSVKYQRHSMCLLTEFRCFDHRYCVPKDAPESLRISVSESAQCSAKRLPPLASPLGLGTESGLGISPLPSAPSACPACTDSYPAFDEFHQFLYTCTVP